MTFEYGVTEREFIDAVLAAGQAPRAEPSRRERWRQRIVIGVGAAAFGSAILLLATFLFDEWRLAIAADGWAAVYRPAGHYEWLLPYVAYSAILCVVGLASPRGLTALRIATAALSAALAATIALVVAAASSDEPTLLGEFGWFRAVPWLAPATTIAVVAVNAWTAIHLRRAYAASPYAAEARAIVTIDDAGVTSELVTATTAWRWSAFTSVRRARGMVLLMISASQIGIILPDRVIGAPGEVDALVGAIASRVARAGRGFAIEAMPRDA